MRESCFLPWTIRYVIRYFTFNILRSHPAMHIEGFSIYALEGALHIAISISFVAVAAICIEFLGGDSYCGRQGMLRVSVWAGTSAGLYIMSYKAHF